MISWDYVIIDMTHSLISQEKSQCSMISYGARFQMPECRGAGPPARSPAGGADSARLSGSFRSGRL
jgi:hypothetical protein